MVGMCYSVERKTKEYEQYLTYHESEGEECISDRVLSSPFSWLSSSSPHLVLSNREVLGNEFL